MVSLSILSLLLACLVKATASMNISPFGLRMCERYCRATVGCVSVLYSQQYLSCILQPRGTSHDEDSYKNFTLKKEKDADVGDAKLSCKYGNRKFLSHKKNLQCYSGSQTRGVAGHRRNAQLLVFRAFAAAEIRQIFLNDVTVHLSRIYRHVNALVYVPSTRKILIILHPYSLFIVDNLKRTPSVRIDQRVRCATVTNDKIFYVKLVKKKPCLWSTTIHGHVPTSVRWLRARFWSIQADLNKSVLYLNDKKGHISKLSYNGNALRSYKQKPGIMCLANDGEFSYFSSFGSDVIYKFSLSNGKLTFLVKLNTTSTINTISVLGKELFFVTRGCDVLFFGPKGTGKIEIDKPSGTGYCSGVMKA